MGDTHEKTHQSKAKTTNHRFLGCFRFSGDSSTSEAKSQKKLIMVQAVPDHHNKQNKSTWLSWSTTRLSRDKNGIKTFPGVDPSVSEKKKKKKMMMKMKWIEKIENKRRLPATKNRSKLELKPAKVSSNGQHIRESSSDQNPAAIGKITSDEASEETAHEEPSYGFESGQKIIRENEEHLDHKDAPQDGLRRLKRLSFWRKTGAAKPGSPEDNPNSSGTTATSCSTSFPAPMHDKPAANQAMHGRVMVKNPSKGNDGMAKVNQKYLDPEIGMSIIIVTLMVLFLHGRLCAIVCTCAFFYFIPRLRATAGHLDVAGKDNLVSDRLDFSSKEYKKKVVLEGLLERSHRSP